jgi:DNA mismatch repair protein MLH1
MAPDTEPAIAGSSAAEMAQIIQLEETVINRIAAGEVVVRPANALKELLENSLDAGSTNIVVNARAGGLKMLRIEDDGHGIRTADLPILCERFTTSKLRKYEDLSSISTFGFRGEALASISHVAHVTVTTMTSSDSYAQMAQYTDGKLRAPPRPCAGTRGTTLVIEDMFYNNATRRGALGKDTVEHSKLLEVVQKYGIHFPKVAFQCRKAGNAVTDLQTQGGTETTTLDVISLVYGQSVAKELFPFEVSSEEARFKCHGYASSPNWTARATALTLFINNRLVESSALKRAIEAVYSTVLPRHQHPWIYLALELDPATIDVNVHPTKSEVQFLYEVMIAERVQETLAASLRERGGSRTFDAPLGGLGAGGRSAAMASAAAHQREAVRSAEAPDVLSDAVPLLDSEMGNASVAKTAAWGMEKEAPRQDLNPTRVRIDHRQRSLESLWRVGSTQSIPIENETQESVPSGGNNQNLDAFEEAQQLTSICELKAEAVLKAEDKLSKAFSQSVYVGPISRELTLLQCGATLCLVNIARVARECAYQRLLRSFGNVAKISLREMLPLKELLKLGVEDPLSGFDPVKHAHVDVDALVAKFAGLLDEKAEMLEEYISLGVSNGMLSTLPNAMGVTSDVGLLMDGLPLFLLRFCTEVNWIEEKECLSSMCRCCSDFCVEALLPSEEEAARMDAATSAKSVESEAAMLNAAVEAGEFEDVVAAAAASSRKRARTVGPNALEELRWLYEALRRDGACRLPGEFARDGTVLELVSLDQLYKIFERC